MSREIRKVAFDGKTVEIEYRETKGAGGTDELTTKFRCPDEPHPDFADALAALRSYVSEICGFCPCWHDAMQVTSVALSGEGGALSASITVHKIVPGSGGFLIVTTPKLPERAPSAAEAALPEGCGDAIRTLVREAELCMDGKRAQGDLFDEGTKPKKRGRRKSQEAA